MGIFPGGVFPGTSPLPGLGGGPIVNAQYVVTNGTTPFGNLQAPSPFPSQPPAPFYGYSVPQMLGLMGATEEEDTPPVISPALRSAIDGLVFAHGQKSPDASPIVAYRGWSHSNGRLMSVGIGTYSWPARRVLEAICARGPGWSVAPHNAPHSKCQCGVYGFATPESLDQVLTSAVLGRVSLGGEVVVCADDVTELPNPVLGFRAQSAYPSLLFLWPARGQPGAAMRHGAAASDDAIKALAEAYGVETAPTPEELIAYVAHKREAAAREHDKMMAARKHPERGPFNLVGGLSTRSAAEAQAATLAALYSEQQAHQQTQMSSIGVANAQGYTRQDATVAKALGLEIATPDTIKLHDALTALARRAGLVK